MDRFNLDNKSIVITGGGGELGYEHACAILEKYGNPILIDIDKKKLSHQVILLEKKFDKKILNYKCDITSRKELDNCFNLIEKKFDKIDGLINNADINIRFNQTSKNLRLENIDLNFWNKHLNIGMTGTMLCSSIYYKHLIKKNHKGVIVNIASDLGIIAPNQNLYKRVKVKDSSQPVKPISYSAVKHGIVGITKYLATYDSSRIRCNVLAPGGVKVKDKSFVSKISKLIPLGRMASKDEYRGAIQFLISDASSYMNGSTLSIDGGRTIY